MKLKVIEYALRTSQASAAREFQVNKSQVSRWCKNSRAIASAPSAHKRVNNVVETKVRAKEASVNENILSTMPRSLSFVDLLNASVLLDSSNDDLLVAKFLADLEFWKCESDTLKAYGDNDVPIVKENYYTFKVEKTTSTNINIVYKDF